MKKNKKKKNKYTKFEKLLYTFAAFLLVVAPVSVVFSKATLSKINFEVEDRKKKLKFRKRPTSPSQWQLMN